MTIHDPSKQVFVSMTASATATACTRGNVLEILTKIRDGEWAAQIAAIRAAPTKEARDALKRQLPGVLWSGEFTIRKKSGLIGHSGLICADFDHVQDAPALRDQLVGDPHCLATFLSPSGDGVKALIAVDPTRPHAESWNAVRVHIESTVGLEIDSACRDVCRLCFISFDPASYIAAGDVAPVPYPTASDASITVANYQAHVSDGTPGEDYNARGDVAALLRKRGWASDDDEHWTRPGKESGTSATLGVVEGPPRSLWVFSSNAPPFTPNKRYEPFHVFALLECGGDFAQATEELQKFGYGTLGGGKILILPSNCGLTISESAQKIFTAIAPTRTMFMRGRVVHEVTNDQFGSRLEPLTPRSFRSRLDRHGRLMAWRADRDSRRKLSPSLCAEETASALLATTEAHTLLPVVRTMLNSPALAMRGTDELVTLGHGWNPEAGGVFVIGKQEPEEVSLPAAVSALSALFDDFDFQTPGDRSRALAAVITPALKAGSLLNAPTPIEVCEADTSQAGKGFLRKLVAAIYGETPVLVTQKEGGVGSLDEAIASALIGGRPFIQLDNLRGKIGSTYLEAILTAEGPVSCREPHKAVVEVDTRPFVFSVTSNGVETTRDLANRCSIARIRKRPPGYPFRTYPEGGILDHVKAQQSFYLGCVHRVVGEWFMQGCQRTGESRHDFRVWAQTLDWIVTNLFGAAQLMEGHNAARDRVCDQGRTWLRAVALALSTDNRLNEEMTASELAEFSGEHDIAVPNCRADVGDMDRSRAVGKAMGRVFADVNTVQVDEFTVQRSRKYSATAGKEIPVYRFSTD